MLPFNLFIDKAINLAKHAGVILWDLNSSLPSPLLKIWYFDHYRTYIYTSFEPARCVWILSYIIEYFLKLFFLD